jgi:hypothetical protein
LSQNIYKNPQAFYAYANRRRTAPRDELQLKLGRDVTSDADTCAEILNQHFCTVFNKRTSGSVPYPVTRSAKLLSTVPLYVQDVYQALCHLQTKKASGPDEIPAIVLRECRETLAWPLLLLFKKSLCSGSLPQDWRDAVVCPIYKSGDKADPTNYRPISLTSITVKVMEKLICASIVDHLEKHGYLHNSQYGFRRQRSCQDQLLAYLHTLSKSLDAGLPADTFYLDMQKAFDKVPHRELLQKLEKQFGLTGQLLRWVAAYLTGRRQRVKVQEAYSDWGSVTSGVPQGSVLGPLLFIMYVDDFGLGLQNANFYKFADDSKMLCPVTSAQDSLQVQSNLDVLLTWSVTWKMPFNVKKSAVMHFGRGNGINTFLISQEVLSAVQVEKDLGIHIDSDLSFAAHIDEVTKKGMRLLGWILRTFQSRDASVLLPLYKSLLRPVLEYSTVVWNPVQVGQIRKIENVQRKFTKAIQGTAGLSYMQRLLLLRIPTLESRRAYFDLLAVHKIMCASADIRRSYFTLQGEMSSIVLRGHSLAIQKPRNTLTATQHLFSSRIVDSWNDLPGHLVTLPTPMFKKLLQLHLKLC